MDRETIIDALTELLPHYNWRRERERTPDGGMSLRALHRLYRSEGRTLSPGALREALGVSGPRVTAILNELEGQGLVTRAPAAGDRRGVSVTLTDAGAAAMEARRARRRTRAERFVAQVGLADAETLVRLLRTAKALEEAEEEGAAECG